MKLGLTEFELDRYYIEPALDRYRKVGWHTAEHAKRMLVMLDHYADRLPADCNRQAMKLAIAYHDIYAPDKDHEFKAADVAMNELPDCVDKKSVSRLILSTSRDEVRDQADERFLHDLDWAQFHSMRTLLEYESKLMDEAVDCGWLYGDAMYEQIAFYENLQKVQVFESFASKYNGIVHEILRSHIQQLMSAMSTVGGL